MKILNGFTIFPFSVRTRTSHKNRIFVCVKNLLVERNISTMILTKQSLKDLLNYADLNMKNFSEEECHKQLKCLLVDNEIRPNDILLEEAFTILLSLCHIKK